MLIVIPFCHRDARAAANLLHWMFELDGQQGAPHHLLLVAAKGLADPLRVQVVEAGRVAFSQVTTVSTTRIDERPWPQAPNTMFRCAATFISYQFKCPFWWHEPDCVPLRSGWLTALESEYLRARKPFMGAVVSLPCKHLTGCAIYPPDLKRYNPSILQADRHAWDCVSPGLTLPHTHHTDLFHHQWAEPDDKTLSIPPTFPDRQKLSIISPQAVVFHRNKDHTLIDRLREEKFAGGVDGVETLEEEQQETPPSLFTPEEEAAPPPPATRKVYTYHQQISGLGDANPLLLLWQKLWRRQGWDPVILSEKHVLSSPQLKPFLATISRLPTVNNPLYERACYLRHLAMFTVLSAEGKGGGLLVDYDVMPRAFTPADLEAALPVARTPLLLLEPTRVPCAVWGTPRGFQSIIDFISSYKLDPIADLYQGRPHTSDMEILRRSTFPSTNLCIEHLCSGEPKRDHPGDGWRTAPLIHFSTYSFHKLGMEGKGQKADWIAGALAALKAETRKVLTPA